MPGEQRHRYARDLRGDDGARGHAKGRVDGVALPGSERAQRFAEARAANDADHARPPVWFMNTGRVPGRARQCKSMLRAAV
jgi:hypothetical protein